MTPVDEMIATADKLRGWTIVTIGQDADDAIQQSMLEGLMAIEQRGDEIRNVAAFFSRILQRQVIRTLRERIRRRLDYEVTTLYPELADEKPDPEELAAAAQERALVERSLWTMRQHEREVLHRFYMQGECREAIERGMQLTPMEFRNAKFNAKKRLIAKVREAA